MVVFIDDVYLLVLDSFSVQFVVILWVIIAAMMHSDRGIESTDIENAATEDI